MKYLKRFGLLFSLFILLTGSLVSTASAQRGRGRHVSSGNSRPVIIYRRPFFGSRFGWRGYYDPYLYDPYLRERQQRYYYEKKVRDNRRELENHRAEYNADGLITAKERKELLDDQEDYAEAIRKLNKFNREY